MPPPSILGPARIGAGDFTDVGRAFLAEFQRTTDVRPTSAVLEIGCGAGRMAIPLADWLRPPGSYDGFDVVPSSVAWCRQHITPRRAHARFQWVDVANSFYNPRGRLSGRSFAFPYRNASFDLVIATSVFTHLLPDTAVAYLAEVRRVLRAGGQLYATWFTLRDGRELLSQADPQFPFDRGGYRVASLEQPEAVVAFDRGLVMEWHARAGLQVETFAEGNWSRGLYEHPYQDVMVVRAAAAP